MAGTALTNSFMLGTASVMIGATSALFDLSTADSIGLVKNFSLKSDPNYVELTQGVKNAIVASVMNQNPTRASMEVYEYTAKNLKYGLGLDGAGTVKYSVASTLASPMAASAVANVHAGDGVNFHANDFVAVDVNGDDEAFIRKINSIATDALTLDHPIVAAASGSAVRKLNVVGVGNKADQPFLAAKVVGKLADGTQVVVLIPKLRIVKGFNMAFSSDQFGNLPFEFTVYDLTAEDDNYAWFGGDQARIFRT